MHWYLGTLGSLHGDETLVGWVSEKVGFQVGMEPGWPEVPDEDGTEVGMGSGWRLRVGKRIWGWDQGEDESKGDGWDWERGWGEEIWAPGGRGWALVCCHWAGASLDSPRRAGLRKGDLKSPPPLMAW